MQLSVACIFFSWKFQEQPTGWFLLTAASRPLQVVLESCMGRSYSTMSDSCAYSWLLNSGYLLLRFLTKTACRRIINSTCLFFFFKFELQSLDNDPMAFMTCFLFPVKPVLRNFKALNYLYCSLRGQKREREKGEEATNVEREEENGRRNRGGHVGSRGQ